MSKRLAAVASLLAAAVVTGCGSSSPHRTTNTTSTPSATSTSGAGNTGPGAPGTVGPEGITIESGSPLAPAATTAPGTKIDGIIQCAPLEQLAYHIHAHLQVYVSGQPRALPGAIGMLDPVSQQTPNGPFWSAQKCIYWLHTHAADGVIHIESPTARIYTLGQFFDEWQQPLSGHQVGSATGAVTAFLNGKPWLKSPRLIPLTAHASVQLSVGEPVAPFQSVNWARSSL